MKIKQDEMIRTAQMWNYVRHEGYRLRQERKKWRDSRLQKLALFQVDVDWLRNKVARNFSKKLAKICAQMIVDQVVQS